MGSQNNETDFPSSGVFMEYNRLFLILSFPQEMIGCFYPSLMWIRSLNNEEALFVGFLERPESITWYDLYRSITLRFSHPILKSIIVQLTIREN